MAIKSIRESYLYSSMNKSGYMDNLLKSAISKSKILTANDLEFEFNTINKYFKYPLKKDVLEAYKAGILKPLVFPPGIEDRLSAAVPFMLGGNGREIVAYVFIDNYKSYNRNNDTYSIDPKKLYCLLESAYIAIIIQKMYPVFSRNSVSCVEGAYIYSHMFTRILNKKYALNVDARAYTKVLYLSAKFFLVNLLSCDVASDTTMNYAMKVADCQSSMLIKEVDDIFTQDKFLNIETFITAIKENASLISQSLNALTVKEFIQDFVNMFHTSAIFSLEHLAYFMFTVDSVCVGAYLNNQVVLEDIIDKSGAKLYSFISGYKI